MKALALCLFSFVLSAVSVLAEETVSDREVWNEGVSLYEQGNATNAVKVLEPLMYSLQASARNNSGEREFCARVAELVAKLKHEAGDREGAAVAARIALWARPDDARTNRNFTRATDGLKDAREAKHVSDVLASAKDKDPGNMLFEATRDARAVMTEAGSYRTNVAARAVALADSLARRAEKLADVWIPVRETIARSVTNEEMAATIVMQLQQAQEKTKKAAKELGDLDAEAYGTMSSVEHDFTRFLKLTIQPPAAMGEDLVAQSNAWQDVETFNNRPWQPDALDYTRAFRSKFPAWAQAYEQQAKADTNMPPFTAEAQQKISGLATELEKIQIECSQKELPPKQEEAVKIIQEILKLLPPQKGGGGGQGNPPPQNQQQKDQQKDQQKQQDQQQNQDQQQDSDQQQDQDPQEQPKDENSKDEQKSDEDQKEDQELEAVLKKAQERNDEHEADKKARMRKAPLPPNERDW